MGPPRGYDREKTLHMKAILQPDITEWANISPASAQSDSPEYNGYLMFLKKFHLKCYSKSKLSSEWKR